MINLNKTIISFLIFLISVSTLANEDLPEIKYEKFTLPNGLRVIVHEDRKIPVVAVNIWYHVGSKNEIEGKTFLGTIWQRPFYKMGYKYDVPLLVDIFVTFVVFHCDICPYFCIQNSFFNLWKALSEKLSFQFLMIFVYFTKNHQV